MYYVVTQHVFTRNVHCTLSPMFGMSKFHVLYLVLNVMYSVHSECTWYTICVVYVNVQCIVYNV